MKYYVLGIYGDIQPMLSEEFEFESDRDELAKTWNRDNETDGGGIFKLDITAKGEARCDSYTVAELYLDDNDIELPENPFEDQDYETF